MHTLLIALVLLADLQPPARERAVPGNLDVIDDQVQPQNLLEPGSPTLLLPVFTRCGGTCPLSALSLKQALEGTRHGFRVVLLSFDSEDTAQDLRDFRERLALPADWLVVRSPDAARVRELLDSLEFHFMKTDGGFNHPNQSFVFSPRGVWAATFSGAPESKEELQSAWRLALAADDQRSLRRVRDWLRRPEASIVVACAGLAAAFAAVLFLGRKAHA